MNKIEKAVMPLKKDAIKRAEQESLKIIEKVRKALEEAGNDLQIVAPYPDSMRMGRNEFMAVQSKYKIYRYLTQNRGCTRRPKEPEYADMCQEYIDRFIEESKETAAFQYDTFVVKLIGKIGDVTKADLDGNHVWGYSFLNVVLPSGENQKWKTQQIVNISKLGRLFNQWPTRKVKT